jgi:uroporphyrinogen decarboxylase
MYGTELIKAMLNKQPVERMGVSGWMHFPETDRNAKDLAKRTIDFTDNNGYDFIKMMFNAHFMTTAYCGKIKYSTDPRVWSGDIQEYPLNHPHDYEILEPLDIENSPLMLEVEATRLVAEHYKGKIPVIATLFSPITCAQEMTSSTKATRTIRMMEYSKKELHHALEALTETNIRFGKKLLEAGADGIFYANQFATTDVITEEQHNEFNRPYDLAVLNALRDAGSWFTIMHIHGSGNYIMDKFMDYPVDAFNWENIAAPGLKPTSITDMKKMTDKLLICGIDQHNDFFNEENDREAIKAVLRGRLDEAIALFKDNNFVFAPGCAMPGEARNYEFTFMREIIDEL